MEVVPPHHQRAGDDVGMAVQIFRHRVGGDVEAELQRPLEEGRREGVVADRDHAAARADLRQRGEVADLEHRIRRRLHPEQLGVRAHRALDRVRIGHVDERLLDPQPLEDLVREPERAAVQVV